MRTITALPYLTAAADAWSPGAWFYSLGDQDPIHLDDRIEGWDYQARLELACEVAIDVDRIRATARIPPDHEIELIVVIDCPAVRERWVGFRLPLPPAGRAQATCQVLLPPGRAAEVISVERQVVLRQDRPAPPPLPSRRGSILLRDAKHRTIALEGNGGRFPVELVDMGAMGYPDALWMLDVDTSDHERAFLGAVRLYVNSEHEARAELLDGSSPRAADLVSAMSWDVLRQLIIRAANSGLEVGPDLEPESLGAVVWSLLHDRLGYSRMEDVVSALDSSAEEFEARLQNAAGLFR